MLFGQLGAYTFRVSYELLYFTLNVADATHKHTNWIHRSNIDERAVSDDVRQTSSPYTLHQLILFVWMLDKLILKKHLKIILFSVLGGRRSYFFQIFLPFFLNLENTSKNFRANKTEIKSFFGLYSRGSYLHHIQSLLYLFFLLSHQLAILLTECKYYYNNKMPQEKRKLNTDANVGRCRMLCTVHIIQRFHEVFISIFMQFFIGF